MSSAQIQSYDAGTLNPAIAELPESEQKQAVLVFGQLLFLHRHSQEFGAAEGLIRHCEEGDVPEPLRMLWSEMAARNTVVAVYHMDVSLRAIRRGAGHLYSLRETIDVGSIRSIYTEFSSAFPSAVRMRHGVAHRADNISSFGELLKHQADNGLNFGSLRRRRYELTYKKEHLVLDITLQNWRTIVRLVQRTYDAFPNLAGKLPLIVEPR